MAAMRTGLNVLIFVAATVLVRGDFDHHEELSRCVVRDVYLPAADGLPARRLADASTVVMMPVTTEGPFFATVDDYYEGASMIAAANGRTSVADGVPLKVTINVYSINGSTAHEQEDAVVYFWAADALGRYSAVSDSMNGEDTSGQKWLRSKAATDAKGQIVWDTIIPGWYVSRTLHFHIRVQMPGSSGYVVQSQLFIDPAVYGDSLKARAPYSSNSASSIKSLSSDSIYTALDAAVREKLLLELQGSMDAGYTASVNIAVGTTTVSFSVSRCGALSMWIALSCLFALGSTNLY
eukprot:TRINITY_DN39386_c0_g1_i1.p1 TRINITY_DN39386_c0_g1~~TRINITY_DN39386_c0_g1_i1.p1  ORF type:complete len:294 (-),score=48.63 TRINITY_DN39386_c0_g1_i1:256-1137(-)